MKTILNLCLRYYPAAGGAEDLNKTIIENLSQRGTKYINYTSYLSDHIANKRLSMTQEIIKYDTANNIHRFNSYKIPKTIYHILPNFIFDGLTEKFDLIHSWTMMYFPAFAGILLKYMKKKPVILNAIVDENNIIYRKKYSASIGKYVINNSDCVTLLTEYSLNVLEKYKYNPKKTEIIPAGIDISEFDNCAEKSEFIKKDKINILFVGRLAYGKGLDLLLKAAKYLAAEKIDFHLNIAGPDFGDEEYCKSFISEYNLKNHITICGSLSRKKLVALYKSSDIFALPSRYEAFGIVLTEAMAARLPVIATDIASIPYVIENEKSGLLIEPNNYNDLAEKLKLLIYNDSLRKQYGDYGYHLCAQKFELSKVIDKYHNLYNSFM